MLNSGLYKYASFENAVKLLRPGCKFTINNLQFTEWKHKDPPPSIEEIYEMIDKIKKFEIENMPPAGLIIE